MVAAVPKEVLEKIVAQSPVGRLGQADEIGRVVQLLVSDEAAFITGATIAVNGSQAPSPARRRNKKERRVMPAASPSEPAFLPRGFSDAWMRAGRPKKKGDRCDGGAAA